jgi:hypothetical protein
VHLPLFGRRFAKMSSPRSQFFLKPSRAYVRALTRDSGSKQEQCGCICERSTPQLLRGLYRQSSQDAAMRSLTRNSVPCNIETSSCRCASSSPASAGSECNERFRSNSRLLLLLSPLRQLSRLADMGRT